MNWNKIKFFILIHTIYDFLYYLIKNFSNCKKRRSRDSFSVKSQQNRKKRRSRVSFSVKSQLEKSVKWQLSLLFSNSILNIATGSTMLKMWSSWTCNRIKGSCTVSPCHSNSRMQLNQSLPGTNETNPNQLHIFFNLEFDNKYNKNTKYISRWNFDLNYKSFLS